MNTTAIPAGELICQLLDAADGIPADTAAVKLIISHENFLHRDAFRRIIRAGTSISTGQPLAVIGWDAALCALEAGQMPCTSSFSELRTIINIRCSGRFPGACWRGERPLDVAFAEAGGGVAEIDRNAGAQHRR